MGNREKIDETTFTTFTEAMQYVRREIYQQMIRDGAIRKGTPIKDLHWQPLFGIKDSANLKNLGNLIGFSCGKYSFRLDWDEAKGFHINYGNDAKNSGFTRAVKVKVSSWTLAIVNNNDPNLLLKNWSIDLMNAFRPMFDDLSVKENKSYANLVTKFGCVPHFGKNNLSTSVLAKDTSWIQKVVKSEHEPTERIVLGATKKTK